MPIAQELPIETAQEIAAAGGDPATAFANAIFGGGINIVSATYTGNAQSAGIFSNGDTISPDATPSDTGVILSTGLAEDFTNDSGTLNTNESASRTTILGEAGDAQLSSLVGGATTSDASILEVVFEPTGPFLTIDFVLSSEEYPEFINSAFNDVVGVWVDNVPATITVGNGTASIGNINGDDTQNIYRDNTGDQFNTEMDGLTIKLTFVVPLDESAPTQTLKIGIADTADSSYDSNLLIAGGSVQSSIVAQDDTITLGNNDTAVLDVTDNDASTAGPTLIITEINGQPAIENVGIPLATGQVVTLNADGDLIIQGDSDAETVYFTYTIQDVNGNIDTGLVEVEQVPCFVAGTWIDTAEGRRKIEDLRAGDLVQTRDDGVQAIRWIGSRTVKAAGAHKPIRLRQGAFSAGEDLLLSPQHRVCITGPWAELLYGEPEVLVAAKHLLNDSSVRRDHALQQVTYFHILFDQHQIIWANNVACESYYPGPMTLPHFDAAAQAEIYGLFPDLKTDTDAYGAPARPLLTGREARTLCAAIAA